MAVVKDAAYYEKRRRSLNNAMRWLGEMVRNGDSLSQYEQKDILQTVVTIYGYSSTLVREGHGKEAANAWIQG